MNFRSPDSPLLRALAAAAFFMAIAASASAQDAQSGKSLALQWCASCHLVAEDQETVTDASLPSFYDLSGDPSWTRETLATFLADPHPKMPNMALGNIEIANLAAYIKSLNED